MTHITQSKLRVLVIDDEPTVIKLLQLHLEKFGGHTVRAECHSTLAVDAALEFKPDIILLDVVMPELDGHEVAQALTERKETKDIPILFISAMSARPDTTGVLMETEHGYFIAKPCSSEQLLSAIQKVLAANGNEPTAS